MLRLSNAANEAGWVHSAYLTPERRPSLRVRFASAEAGRRLRTALEMGASQPWPDALEVLTGDRQLDASAMAELRAAQGMPGRAECGAAARVVRDD